jgi:serine-type D-Ala-D-Ala carboxypeptidase
MIKKKLFSFLLASTLIFSGLSIKAADSGKASKGGIGQLSGQLVVNFDRTNREFTGKFYGHKGEGRIIIEDKQRGTILLYINGNKVNLSNSIHKPNAGLIEIAIDKYVVEGENEINIRTTGKDSTTVIVPYLTLKVGTPEEAGMNSAILNGIDTYVNQRINAGVTPGAVVLVAKDGLIVKNTAYGHAQKYDMGKLLDTPRVMTTDSIFDMASVTKVMATTQAVMKLASEGKLAVKDKVVKFIPEFGKNGKENVTIEDLLTHTSGLTPWKPTYYHVNNSQDELKFICDLPLEYETGTKRLYSDFSFMTLGFIIEKITGQRLDQYLRNDMYLKLGMEDSMFAPPKSLSNRIAATSWGNPYEYRMVATGVPYPCDEDVDDFKGWRNYTLVGEVNDGNSFYANGGIAGHAGLFSTAKDLAILGQAMLNGGGYDTTKIYNKSVLDEFTKPQRFTHGYGWEVNRTSYMGAGCSTSAFGHTGFTGTQVIFDPVRNLQIIVLTNKQNNGLNSNNSYNSTFAFTKTICDTVYSAINE